MIAVRRAVGALHPFAAARSLGPSAVAHAIHGLVLFTAIMGATSLGGYPAANVLIVSTGSVVLFWVAHVYSAVLAHQEVADGSATGALAVVRHEAATSLAMLHGCLAPAVPLVLATAGLLPLPLAYAASLAVVVVSLTALGFLALRNRGASLLRSLVSGIGAGSLGAGIILAETFWH